VIAAVLIPFAAAVLTGLVLLSPGGAPGHERTGVGFDRQTERGEVVKVEQVDCAAAGAPQQQPPARDGEQQTRSPDQDGGDVCDLATVEVTSGQDAGRTFTEIVQPDATRKLRTGQGVVVAYAPDAPR
jgi:hypothetical protein